MVVYIMFIKPFEKKRDFVFYAIHEVLILAACCVLFILFLEKDEEKKNRITWLYIFIFCLAMITSLVFLFFSLDSCCRKESTVKPESPAKRSPEKIFLETNKTLVDQKKLTEPDYSID